MVTLTCKKGDPIQFKVQDKWIAGEYRGSGIIGASTFVKIKNLITGRHLYTLTHNVRPADCLIEGNNPNRTFKLRKEK